MGGYVRAKTKRFRLPIGRRIYVKNLPYFALNTIKDEKIMQINTEHFLIDPVLSETLLNSFNEALLVTNEQGIIVKVNQAFCLASGYSEQEVIGQTPKMLQSGKQGLRFYQQLWHKLLRDGFWSGQICNKKKNGEFYEGWLKVREITHPQFGRLYISVLTELSETHPTRSKLEKLHKLAYFDELTGLANRNHFLQFIRSYLEEHPKGLLALLFIDLDKFKYINDQFGHQEGDWVLKMVAERIQSMIRESDFASRIGGDEFVVVLSDIKQQNDAFKVATTLLNQISKPYTNDVFIHSLAASIGIAFYPQDADNVEELLNIADLAMYQAKRRGDKLHIFADIAKK